MSNNQTSVEAFPITFPLPEVDSLVGPAFLGTVLAGVLYGITTLQTYTYFHKYARDPGPQKAAVVLLLILDTAHMWTTIQGVYMYIVKGFGNLPGMNVVNWPLKLGASIQVVLIVLVQILYAQRIWKLSGMHGGILKYFVALVVAAGAGLGVVLAITTWQKDTFTQLEADTWIIYSAFGAATAIDLGISVSLVWYLGSSVAPSSALNSVISRAMQYSLGSGAVTSTCSLACVLAFLLRPHTFIFVGMQFLLTKFYTASYMAMLNARLSHRSQLEDIDTKVDSFNLTSLPKLYKDQQFQQRLSVADYNNSPRMTTFDPIPQRPSPAPPLNPSVDRSQPSFNNSYVGTRSQGSLYSQHHPLSYASVESELTHIPEGGEYYKDYSSSYRLEQREDGRV